jgi:opacity protein-like surface antigen
MKKTFLIILTCFAAYSLNAQSLHLNLFGGVSNYGGDLQSQGFTFKQTKPVFALGLGYEISEKFFVRGEYSFTNLGADDALSNNYFQLRRNLNFKTVLQELNLVAEYDILNNYDHQLVPYVFAGLGVFQFSPYTYDSLGKKVFLQGLNTEGQGLSIYPDRAPYKKVQVNIPFGAGVKFALSDNIRVGAELGFRKLFTDYLDDVSTDYPDLSLIPPGSAALSYRGDELKPPIPFPVPVHNAVILK